jgi:hypothetical protein
MIRVVSGQRRSDAFRVPNPMRSNAPEEVYRNSEARLIALVSD